MIRLAILSTHPIQYNAPLFRLMAAQEGWTVRVFFSRTWNQVKFDPDFQQEVQWDIPLIDGYNHTTVDASAPLGARKLISAIRDFKPDSLLVYGWNFPGHYRALKSLHGSMRIGFRGDSHILNPLPPWKRWIRKVMLNRVYRNVDLAFSVGSANTEYFKWSGVAPGRILLAPHAVDMEYWLADATQRTAAARLWRSELGIPDGAGTIGFAGKLEPIKQVDRLISAFIEQRPNSHHLIIAGTGPMEAELKTMAMNHPRIHFIGFVNQSQMPVFYRMLNVFALPSSSETWGLSINEALTCGIRCLVSNRVGCGSDIFKNPRLGDAIPWDDTKKWSESLQQALAHPPMTADAHSQFLEDFSYQKFIAILPELWNN